jgi:hypothetical protein
MFSLEQPVALGEGGCVFRHNLEALRRQLLLPPPPAAPNLVDQLFGALGHGTRDEYDMDLWLESLP